MRIFLMGFMGAGKTIVGKELARICNRLYIDADELIERRAAKSIAELFETEGEAHFRTLEHELIQEIGEFYPDVVVACGGGMPCFNNNIALIKQYGLSVYLKLKPELLAERLKDDKGKRPLLKNLSDQERLAFIQNKLAERSAYYEQANVIIEVQKQDSITEIAQEIVLSV